jgi:hypothetical protein
VILPAGRSLTDALLVDDRGVDLEASRRILPAIQQDISGRPALIPAAVVPISSPSVASFFFLSASRRLLPRSASGRDGARRDVDDLARH